jgi:hypothetical protein
VVLSRPATGLVPALVVPDEQTWTMAGTDPASLGVEPVFAAAAVRRVLTPDEVPDALVGPLADYLDGPPPEHAAHAGHEHHDHHDMMAIRGEPSADGLVMEPIELRYGPLGTPLPGGLVADVTLDGDVVAECELAALLVVDDPAAVPDRLAPTAWDIALTEARLPLDDRWRRIAAVEVERALSHTTWLRSFGRLLGWPKLVERTSRAVTTLIEAQRLNLAELGQARSELDALGDFVRGSHWLAWRAGGRAHISADRARELGLHGPVARASGVVDDARLNHPLYERLGFEPVIRAEGDALARTLVRASEAAAAVELAMRALEAGVLSDALPPASDPAIVEGPRGPLHARLDGSRWHLDAPGQAAALTAAGACAVGAEWAAALVGLASFDLSPWRVGA